MRWLLMSTSMRAETILVRGFVTISALVFTVLGILAVWAEIAKP